MEVVDYGSDLIFYDVDKGTIRNILKTDADLETFPCWAPDGKKLYYCVAHVPEFAGANDSVRMDRIIPLNQKVRYNVMSMTFDETTGQFGKPQLEVDCVAMNKSAAVPRISPDGRFYYSPWPITDSSTSGTNRPTFTRKICRLATSFL